MRRIFVLLAILMTGLYVTAQQDNQAKQILEEVSEKTRSYKNLSADFIFTLENKEMDINEKSKGSIILKGDKYVVTLPDVGSKIYSNGKTVWNYMEEGNQVIISSVDEEGNELMDPSTIFSLYERGFRSKFDGEKKEGNKVLYEIELYPDNNEEISRIILNINKSSKMIDSAKFYGTDGNLYGVEVKQLKTNIDVKDSFFVFNAEDYKDLEVIDFR